MSERNKEIVDRVNAAFAEANIEGFLSHCADGVEWTIVGDRAVEGKDAIREWLSSMNVEPPKFTVGKVIGEGDDVMAYGEMTMSDAGGEVVPYAFCDIYRFDDGKIVRLTSFVVKAETG